MKTVRLLFVLLFSLAAVAPAPASSVLPLSTDVQIRAADAVFRGTVLKVAFFRNPVDGMIYTRSLLRVDEAFKGKLPAVIQVVHHGGVMDGIGQSDDGAPQFKTGEERLLFVRRRPDRTLFALQGNPSAVKLNRTTAGNFSPAHSDLLEEVRRRTNGGSLPGADVTDQAADADVAGSPGEPSGDTGGPSANGLLVDQSFGHPMRYIRPDRGEPVPYLVDTNHLPAGITPSQGLTAVSNALAAWTAVSTFKFVFLGTQAFPTNTAAINTNDGVFRIQLHDAFNYILESNVLGKGGSYFTVGLLPAAGWGPGGNVAGAEFNQSVCGFVILKHTNSALQNFSTLSEVLTHEIGHVLGLAHSSEDPNETNAVLQAATMYFLVHADGRGAGLGAYDPPVVRKIHPANTPPYSFDRVMDATTASPAPDVAGINSIELRGFDLQTPSAGLTSAVTNVNLFAGGTFSVVGQLLKFVPPNFADSSRLDPAGTGYYDLFYTRCSDATNASPYTLVRVISFSHDNFPLGASDGIPDNWMTAYFNNADPAVGSSHSAANDLDADGMNNLSEFRAGMAPTNPASAQRITSFNGSTLQWQARPFELYEIQGSTNLTSWSLVRAVLPTNAPIDIRTNVIANTITAVASNLPAGNSQLFFRVLKVP